MAKHDDDDEGFIRWPEVHRLTTLSRSHAYRLERKGLFPKSHQLSKNVTVWVRREILAWVAERAKAGAKPLDAGWPMRKVPPQKRRPKREPKLAPGAEG